LRQQRKYSTGLGPKVGGLTPVGSDGIPDFYHIQMCAKIEEHLRTGRVAKLQTLDNDPYNKVLQLFTSVHGAGPSTARQWSTAHARRHMIIHFVKGIPKVVAIWTTSREFPTFLIVSK